MDTRRTTLIATIVLIALLAVGIGYAYTAYTENAGNNTDISYVTLTQTGTTGYTFAEDVDVEMDTYSEEIESVEKIYYRLNESQNLKNGSDTYTLKTLGSIKLHAAITGGDSHPDLKISVAGSTNFDASENWFYIIGSEPDTDNKIKIYAIKDDDKTKSSWTAGPDAWTMAYSGSAYVDETINVYYGYNADNTITKAGLDYMKISEMPKNLDDASLLFMASNDDQVTIVYHSGDYEYTVYNTKNDSKKYSLTSKPENLGFIIPAGKTFQGWGASSTATSYITEVTIEGQATSADVYAIYA